jgi:glycosyltransferase involved in cell wall biosynthesis
MNVFIVNTIPSWGGGEQWTLQTALELRRRGHRVNLVAAQSSLLARRTEECSLPLFEFPPPSSWGQIRAIRDLRRMVRQGQPDLWLTNCLRDIWLVNSVQLVSWKRPIIFRRGLDRPVGDNLIRRRRLRKVSRFLVNSRATQRTLLDSFPWLSKKNVDLIYNAIDSREFLNHPSRRVRKELGITDDAFVVGVIGRLSRQKGHLELFQAFSRLLSAKPNARLLIVGDGECASRLQADSRHLKIAEVCHFTGFVDTVQPYYEACDMVAIPSHFEGFCFTAAEAQLMRRPVVAFQTSSLPEVVEDGRTGFLVKEDDLEGFADRMIQLASDSSLCVRMGNNGRRYVHGQFAVAPIYDELEAVLKSVVRESETEPAMIASLQ